MVDAELGCGCWMDFFHACLYGSFIEKLDANVRKGKKMGKRR